MLLTSISMPLLASITILLFGRHFNRIGTSVIILYSLGFSLISSLGAAADGYLYFNIVSIKLFDALTTAWISLTFSIVADYLSVFMVNLVLFISVLVHLYSVEYMKHDPHFNRFMAYLSLFTFFMLVLLVSVDFIQFFLGWEGVGLCSFLLISFWFTRTQAATSALKAFIINRVGDSFFLFGILLVGYLFGALDIKILCYSADWMNIASFSMLSVVYNMKYVIALSLFVGAMSKSAQIFLHTWLPDAMEGPTPVSSLIHAATMVAAGIFLLARLSKYFVDAPEILVVFSIIGSLTAIFAAITGVFQNDIKKIIAYSTCSQLGFMLAAAGMGAFAASMYHLTTHAFFKALLFLVSGAIIHSLADIQDVRRYGSLLALLPYSYICILIGSLALTGLPFFSGFYSKDLIIETTMVSNFNFAFFSTLMLVLSSCFTMLYSVKLVYMTFFVRCNMPLPVLKQVTESPIIILLVLTILSLFSIFAGWYFKNIITAQAGFLTGNILVSLPAVCGMDTEFIPIFVKHSVLVSALTGCYFGLLFNISEETIFNKYLPTFGDNTIAMRCYFFFAKKWYFDAIYNFFVAGNSLRFSYFVLLKNLELGFLEASGPFLLFSISKIGGLFIEILHKKTLTTYLIYFFYTLFVIMFFQIFNFYFVSSICLIVTLVIVLDYLQSLSINRVKLCFISMFHKRRMLFIRRTILKKIFFIYVYALALFVFYTYMFLFYFIINYLKYGELIPSWLII